MVEVIKDINLFLEIIKKVAPSPNAYLSYAYYSVYMKYNKASDFVAYCVKNDEEYIGVLPLTKKGMYYNIVGYRASNYLGYICSVENENQVDEEIRNYFKTNKKNIVINYYDINSSTNLYSILSKDKRCEKIYLYECPYVNVNQSFETLFVSQVTKSKKRAELKKFRNKLDRVGNVDFVNIDSYEKWKKYGHLISEIYPVHEARFHGVYIPEDLCLHKNEKYYTELFEELVKDGSALLSLLLVDGIVVSFLYTAVSDGVVMDWMPAFDPAFSKFNLGTVHLMMLLQYLCSEERYKVLDFSKGAAIYKARWSCDKTENFMFVRRFSDTMVSRVKNSVASTPIKLKNYLRSKGILDSIKNILAKRNVTRESNISQQKEDNIIYINEETPNLDFNYLDFKTIASLPLSARERILNAIYLEQQPQIAFQGDKMFIRVEENND